MKDIPKLSRAQINKALDTVPVSSILGKHATRELTPKQRRFALEIAKGAKGAEAYRKVYSDKGKAKTQGDDASRLKRHPGVSAEIEAYRAALEAAEYRTPAALRALVIQTLTQTLLDGDVAPAVRVQAAKILGTVTEVAAFTARSEVRTVNDSATAREELLNEIKDLMRTVDMPSGASDAEALLSELGAADTHQAGTPRDAIATHHGDVHTNPPIQSENVLEVDPTPSDGEAPRVDGTTACG